MTALPLRLCPHRETIPGPLATAERACEKQAAREQDAADLASGAKTREQLHAENAAFAGYPRG